MNDIAIRVENLSKLYRIGARQEPYRTLRDTLAGAASAPFRRIRSAFQPKSDQPTTENEFWALKDVSFEVKRGEVVGIIGRNGAGKSTLLKILSRITEPTSGHTDIHGRVGSLLEVGTGFHPELTGRENIYLNGAILGMKRAEIDRQFDAIVEFAEVEKFVDTAVKHYSSGMYLRLAFAVAAHLEPEILLVDEVLAVGDAAFQKKCLGKMGEVAREGRTVFLVSHNMSQIRRLCDKGLWIKNGKCEYSGAIDHAIAAYQSEVTGSSMHLLEDGLHHRSQMGFISWEITNSPTANIIQIEGPLNIDIYLQIDRPVINGYWVLVLQTPDGKNIAGWVRESMRLAPGTHKISCHFREFPFRQGSYIWYTSLWDGSNKIDVTSLTPELIITTANYSVLGDDWGGHINVPCDISLS